MMEDGINELLVHVTPSYLYSMPRTPSIGIDLQKKNPGWVITIIVERENIVGQMM